MQVLIADDAPVSRRLAELTIANAGFEVKCAADGESAAAILCANDGPRLAVIDWMMPGMDGPEVCKQVRRKREQPYVYMILLTSKEAKDDVIEGLGSGADDYLTKPFHAEELKARLRTGQRILQLEDKLIEAREGMRYDATHDGLTTLWNRGMILDLLDRELQRGQREHTPVALFLGDVDHFKQVNDTYGHAVGDEVLRETARRLVRAVRPYDLVGRYGGEEFLLVLPGCHEEQAQQRAESIRRAICKQPFETSRGTIGVTMSLGVATSLARMRNSAETLLQDADEALYRAKAEGRDRVVLAKQENEAPVPVKPR